jgi:hypothetical protein
MLAESCAAIPEAVSVIFNPSTGLMSLLSRFVSNRSPEAIPAFALLSSAFSSPFIVRRAILESDFFTLLQNLILCEDYESPSFLLESSELMKRMTSVGDFPAGFGARLFPLLTQLYNANDKDVMTNAIESITNLQINGYNLESFVVGSTLIEDLTAFLRLDGLSVPTLRLLAVLCPYGDPLLAIMRRHQTVAEVRLLFGGCDPDTVDHALIFFANWLSSTADPDYLFDQITSVDFVSVCSACTFNAKYRMVDLVFRICDAARQNHIARLVTPRFVETVADHVGCLPEALARQAMAAVVVACEKCQTVPGFAEAVADALRAAAGDAESADPIWQVVEDVEGLIGGTIA